MTRDDRYGGYTPRRATKFYIPLLLQAFSQSLTYPLVASIVAHGEYGVKTLTAFAQGQTVMFMIGAFGGGLVMTGMVFARTRAGYRSFIRLNTIMMVSLLSVQLLACVHPFDTWIFRTFLNLPPELAEIARRTTLWGVIMQGGFFLRNVPLVALFNARASFEANIATVARIVLTASFPYFFIRLGWTGAMWGLTAITLPCMLELLVTWWFARRYVREIPEATDVSEVRTSSAFNQFRFTLPLSFGGSLLAAAPFMIAAFVGRSTDAVAMLAIHYVTIGLANPVGYASLRMQPVAIEFPPEYAHDRRMIRFSIGAGLILGLIPLIISIPSVSRWYFNVVQNVPMEHIGFAQTVMAFYALWPVFQTLRGHAEGYCAWLKKPMFVLNGQIAYLSTLVITLAVSLHCEMAGWKMGIVAIFAATLAAIAAIHVLLFLLSRRETLPVRADRHQ